MGAQSSPWDVVVTPTLTHKNASLVMLNRAG